MKTICYVIIGLDYAGAEIQLVAVVRRMRARGWRVFVVSLLTPAAFVAELFAIGVPVLSLDLEKGERLSITAITRFLALLREVSPDIVHGHMVHSNLLARLAAASLRIPVAVATVHSTDEGGRTRLWLYRATERMGTLTTSVSEAGRTIHIASGASSKDRIVVVPNGIDADRFRADDEARQRIRRSLPATDATGNDAFVWLSVTRFHWPKDPVTLLRAMAMGHGSSQLWLVGQGSEQAQVEASVKALGLTDRVHLLGLRTDIPDLLSGSDGFVLSSLSEAMPITLLEAASASRVCVASDVGAVRDLVDDGVTGFVVPPGDPAALSQAMARTEALTPDRRDRMGGIARERTVARWSLDAVVDRWEALYEEALAAGPTAGQVQRLTG